MLPAAPVLPAGAAPVLPPLAPAAAAPAPVAVYHVMDMNTVKSYHMI